LATNFHMLLNWISRFNPPMHSIHVDHDIHTIFSRMMAATHFVLRPPLPLLSLSPGYFPRTKGSGLPTPHFFFLQQHHFARPHGSQLSAARNEFHFRLLAS
jgi:hypothetical protein